MVEFYPTGHILPKTLISSNSFMCWECVLAHGRVGQRHFFFFPFPNFQTARKIFREASPAEWRGEPFDFTQGKLMRRRLRRFPFPLNLFSSPQPPMLEVLNFAFNFQEFLIK